MGLETATYVDDLTVTNPVASDVIAQGDDHMRLLKSTLKATFPDADHAIYIEKARADIASATSTDVGAATTNYLRITGTTQIDGFTSAAAGIWRNVVFAAALQLTYNATSFILPSAANITTAAGDTAIFVSEGSGNWRCIAYTRASGKALVETDQFPSQSGNAGKFAKTDGSVVSWAFPVPVGLIAPWPTDTPPSGWLACDGSAVSRTTYANLFAVISDDYGPGDGSTTFNLPNYEGYFLRGWDNSAGVDPDAASRTDRGDGTTGDNVGTVQADEYKSHTHLMLANETDSSEGVPGASQQIPYRGNYGSGQDYTLGGTGTAATLGITGPSGGNETRAKNKNVLWIIKT